jgi:CRP-like cAMP-binding protein
MTEQQISGPMTHKFPAETLVCKAGELNHDLYLVHSGSLLVFVNNGTNITPIAYLKEGEYLGELAFFDQSPRSAHVITLEETTLIQIPVSEIESQFPRWLIKIAQSMTKKIRGADELLREKGIRRKNTKGLQALSIEQQRALYQKIEQA